MNIRDKTDNLRVMRKEATLELKEAPKQERKVFFSIETQEILERRGKALERGEEEEYQRLAKEFRKKQWGRQKIWGYKDDSKRIGRQGNVGWTKKN